MPGCLNHRSPALRALAVGTLAFLMMIVGMARGADAADDRDGSNVSRSAASQSGAAPQGQAAPDFLFGRPHGWVNLNGTWLFPRAGGDLFAFVGDQLTVDRTDFRSHGIGAEVGFAIAPRFDVVARVDGSRHSIASEYRAYVKPDRSPIAQDTRLSQSSFSAGVRFSPTGHGRRVSRYAFIPRRVTPYAGGGLTVLAYTFAQKGQFVDAVDLSIFSDTLNSNGWAAGPYAQAGADVQVWRRLFVTFDARYTWVRSSLDSDFVGFNGIDLAGFQGSTGISLIF